MKRKHNNRHYDDDNPNPKELHKLLMKSMKADLPSLEKKAEEIDDPKAKAIVTDLLNEIRQYPNK